MSSDILSLFSKFGLGRLPCRLSLEKHDGISAVQLILSLCLFRINGETIHSIYKKNFYHLLTKTKYFVENKRHNVTELVAMYTRRTKCCRKYKCQYIELRGCLGNIPVRIYLIKHGRRQTWNIMLSTNLLMSFVRAFELYQIRWNIEVVNKETKEYLGLGSYMGCDGTVDIQCGYAYSLAILKRKKLLSTTPLKLALNSFIFALKDSAAAFVDLLI